MFDDEQQNEQNNQDLNNFTEGLDADVINNASETSSYTDSSVQKTEEETPVTVQPVKFASFDEEENVHGKENRNLDLLMNVNLLMSVELEQNYLLKKF